MESMRCDELMIASNISTIPKRATTVDETTVDEETRERLVAQVMRRDRVTKERATAIVNRL
jgi:hypothetical protein